ncbi:MAG TPA: hypothetical protein VFB37_12050 [Steroidobacteraceae bacterium]|nr:hypothetical protein [Steroidobacteraceae bacterium]
MWRIIRTALLLLVLIWAAAHTWLDRFESTRWHDPLWVGIFPVNADGSTISQQYIDALTSREYADIEAFFVREAQRYGKAVTPPVHMVLYPQSRQTPPVLERNAGPVSTAWWSLKLRWYAFRAADTGGRPPPRIRLFVLYHDPTTLQTVADSHGLQKGLLGVVHVFALRPMAGSNSIVIAHELLHTLGATDKYDLRTGMPDYPSGFAEPDRRPLYPQPLAEIMAGRQALSASRSEMPGSLRDVVVGPATAREIRWTNP